MSCSSLWVMDKDFYGECIAEFENSWFFSPVAWNVLSDKYLPKVMGMPQQMSNAVYDKLNKIENGSNETWERVVWEFSHCQIFRTKDKELVADSICKFLKKNSQYNKSKEDGIGILRRDHIIERWEEIAQTIREIDENEFPYFVFKCTSVDDLVESWFYKYNEETDEEENTSLRDIDHHVREFVIIHDGKIVDFVSNVVYTANH